MDYKQEPDTRAVVDRTDESGIPAGIMSLVGVASSISEEDIKNDDRLAYLLRK